MTRRSVKGILDYAMESWKRNVSYKKAYEDADNALVLMVGDAAEVGMYTDYRVRSDNDYEMTQYYTGKAMGMKELLEDFGIPMEDLDESRVEHDKSMYDSLTADNAKFARKIEEKKSALKESA